MRENTSFANLSEKELHKIQEAEKYLNNQTDDKEGKEVILLAYTVDKKLN